MPPVSIATLLGAACFASFHLPIPALASGKGARLLGVAYHLLLLPAVAALPAPAWARAAGFAWMLIDAALNAAVFAGLRTEVSDALRQGVHVLSALWVLVAGWNGGVLLGIVGTLLAAAFLARFLLAGGGKGSPAWLRHVNAVLNVLWWVLVAIVLWRT